MQQRVAGPEVLLSAGESIGAVFSPSAAVADCNTSCSRIQKATQQAQSLTMILYNISAIQKRNFCVSQGSLALSCRGVAQPNNNTQPLSRHC